jgi:hypothetical protein
LSTGEEEALTCPLWLYQPQCESGVL